MIATGGVPAKHFTRRQGVARPTVQPRLRSGPARLLGFVVFIGVVWGVTYGFYPVGLQRAGPIWLSAMRFEAFAVAAFAFAWILDKRLPLPRERRDYAAIATYGILNVIIHNVATIGGSGHVP